MERSPKRVRQLVRKLITAASRLPHYTGVTVHTHGYADQDYDEPVCGLILTANWNPADFTDDAAKETQTMSRLWAALERLGIEQNLEWGDEWAECSSCHKLVRVSGDCYDWQPCFWKTATDLTCAACLQKDPTAYLKWLREAPATRVVIGALDLEALGYQTIDDTISIGLHPGMNDSLPKICAFWREYDVLIQCTRAEQFECKYTLWAPKSADISEDMIAAYAKIDREQRPSPEARMRAALKAASAQAAALPNPTYSILRDDGTALTRSLCSEVPNE